MELVLKTWLLALGCALLADVAAPLRISGAQLVGSGGPLAGVFRSTYKEPRPVRSASRNLAREEATVPESDARVSRSSHQTPLLIQRLLEEEHAEHEEPVERTPSTHGEQRVVETEHVDVNGGVGGVDVSGAEFTRTVHPSTPHETEDDVDGADHQSFSYQQFDLDASREEQLQDIDEGHSAKTAPHTVDAGAKYEYVYQVAGDHHGEGDFGHAESRDGARTWGRYYVHQPDGKVKTVRYWADHSGYHAQVDYHAAPGHGGGVEAPEVHEEPEE